MNHFENFGIGPSSDGKQYYLPSIKILLNSIVYELFAKKLCFDPYVLFLVAMAMFVHGLKIQSFCAGYPMNLVKPNSF